MNDKNHPSRRRVCSAALGAALTTACAVAALPALAQTFPARDFSGVIMWGAGGATDVVARAVAPLAEEALGRKIVLQNRSGGAGAISTNFVNQQASDGYTLLMGAENPQLHGVMSLGELDYSKFYPVNILGRGVGVIVAHKDKPWKSVSELIADARRRERNSAPTAGDPGLKGLCAHTTPVTLWQPTRRAAVDAMLPMPMPTPMAARRRANDVPAYCGVLR